MAKVWDFELYYDAETGLPYWTTWHPYPGKKLETDFQLLRPIHPKLYNGFSVNTYLAESLAAQKIDGLVITGALNYNTPDQPKLLPEWTYGLIPKQNIEETLFNKDNTHILSYSSNELACTDALTGEECWYEVFKENVIHKAIFIGKGILLFRSWGIEYRSYTGEVYWAEACTGIWGDVRSKDNLVYYIHNLNLVCRDVEENVIKWTQPRIRNIRQLQEDVLVATPQPSNWLQEHDVTGGTR